MRIAKATLQDGSPVTDGNWFFQTPNLSVVLYVHAGIVTDAVMDAVRELRKVPTFQRHEGKRALNVVYRRACELDERLCALSADGQLGWLERTKDRFADEISIDILRYRTTVRNIVGRTAYPYADSYAYATIASSLARITAETQKRTLWSQFGATISYGTGCVLTPSAPLARYKLYGMAFHRGHVSGFREGLAVTKDDRRRLEETHRQWRDLSERPHYFPCLLLLRTTNPMGRPLYSVRCFATLTAYTTFCVSRNESPTATLWYDIRRIS